MSERDRHSQDRKPTAAVLRPYPKIAIGGVARICELENEFLNNHGFHSKEVTPRLNWLSTRWEDETSMSLGIARRANHERLRTDAWWAISDPTEIGKLFKLARYDLIDCHEAAMYMPAYFLSLLRRMQFNNPNLVTIGTLHAQASEEHIAKFKLSDELQYRLHLMDIVVVNTPTMKQRYEKVLKSEFEVVENPVDLKKFSPTGALLEFAAEQNLLDGKTNIVYVGRLEKRKGLETALVAISVLKQDPQQQDNFRFLIAGRGPDEQKLKDLAKNLGLKQTVIFLGPITDQDKSKLYRTASFCYFPSESEESFGQVILEAMASGKAVLSGVAYGDLLVKDNQTGFCLQSTNPLEAAQELRRMITDKTLVQNMGANAHQFVQQFDADRVFEKKLMLAQRVLRQKHERLRKQKTHF